MRSEWNEEPIEKEVTIGVVRMRRNDLVRGMKLERLMGIRFRERKK